jgi:DNA-binding beta-propeller fold protein YncE
VTKAFPASGPALTRRAWFGAAGLASALAACRGGHGEGYRGALYVALETMRSIAVVDLLAFGLRGHIALNCTPAGLAADPDPHRAVAFVTGFNGTGAEQSAVLERVDLAARRSTARIGVGRGVPILRKDPRGLLWTAAGETRLRAWRASSLQPAGTLNFAARVVDFDFATHNVTKKVLLCASLEGGLVQFAEPATGRVGESVRCSAATATIRFRQDGRVALVTSPAAQLLTVVDWASGRIMTELPLPLQPAHLCLSPDGGQIFLTGPGRDAVVVVYPYRTEVALTSLSGRMPAQMACSSRPLYLFVSNPSANSVSVFDVDTQKIVAVTGVGAEPGSIVLTPDEQYALVLNQGSGDVAVIRVAAIRGGRERRAPLFTMIPVGGRPIAALVRMS